MNPTIREIRVICGLSLAALLLLAPRLAAAAALNWASLRILPQWQRVADAAALPECPTPTAPSPVRPMLERALRWQKDHPRLLILLGRAAWLEGRCDQAMDLWGQAIDMSPHDVIARWQAANALYVNGHREKAITLYRSAHAASYFYHQARRAWSAGDLDRARAGYEMSLSIAPTPKDAAYWWAMGQIAEINQDWDAALQAYQQAIPLEKDRYRLYELYMRMGTVSQRRGDYPAAAEYFEWAIETNPESIWAYLSRGYVEHLRQRYDEAVSWYHRAGEISPESEWPLYYQGVSLWEAGERVQAQMLFIQAARKNPQNASVQFYLGLAAHEEGRVSTAITYLQQAIALSRSEPVYWLKLLGKWHLEAGNCAEAIAVYQRLLERHPDDVDIQQRLKKAQEACP